MSSDDRTHLEEAELAGALTHLEGQADSTRLEGGDGLGLFQRVNLPDPLAERFEVVGGIPGGAEADLLIVRPRDGGETSVVKIYRLRLAPPPEDVRERIAAADAAHVVRVEAPETWRGVTYEVMEHCALGSLRGLIEEEGPLGEDLVREILVELHSALEHVHSPAIGLVHRDLKPANVLVRTREPLDLVLADFGLSEIIGDHSKLFLSAKRTIAYAAPEATHGNINRKSDWWSVGMCVAEMLLGAHPILRHLGPGATEQSVSQWISDRPIPLDQVPGRWLTLCEGLLTKEADDRWGEREVRRWLAGENPEIRRPATAVIPTAPGVAPFAFSALSGEGFEAYDDSRLLAGAFALHWGEALAIVSGEQAKRGEARRLATFVQELELGRAQAILLEEGDDEARLVRLRLALDPECEPVFRGIDLAGDGLQRFAASAAASNGTGNAATCSALLDARVLSAHAAQPARREWATIDAQWLASDRYAIDQLVRLRTQARLPALDDAGAAAIRAQLLNAIVDPQAAARLNDAANTARHDEHARTQEWFQELADHQPAPRESLGLDVTLTALEPIAKQMAEAQRRTAEAERRATEAERRASREAELQRALDAHPQLPQPSLQSPPWKAGKAVGGLAVILSWMLGFVLVAGIAVAATAENGSDGDAWGLLAVGAVLGAVVGVSRWHYLWLRSREYERAMAAFHEREADRDRIRESFEARGE